MNSMCWDIKPGAVLLFALLYFFDESGVMALILPAVIIHELGHFAALSLGGIRVKRLSLGIFGFELDYWGKLGGMAGAVAIAAGPLLGLVYAAVCFSLPFEFWRLSGALSLSLSIFNLLPVLPLDGGRLMALAIGERAEIISRGISIVLAAVGLMLWLHRGWVSVFAMGLWLVWGNYNNKDRE